ncbi:carbohydrate ABC transporter permease [Actinotalea ferrariae]|uniref:carbohydrate ABC transporter permease n=1 Tax=Actinotalea ferrariae TaxID=1386098 RepID=UPI001C8BCFCE|nr:carbohydrate ABC transporter permease [Actinotalea ferrariae]MBX9243864.1 carbohydrate ABC transporter permease [Actinotalea ferrariae]
MSAGTLVPGITQGADAAGPPDAPRPHRGGRRPPTARRVIGTSAWYVGVILVSVATVLPLVWTLATSFKPGSEILSNYLQLLPDEPTLDNYREVFARTPFARYLVNSFVIAIGGTITNVVLGSMAGYALAKLKFQGRKVAVGLILGSMMVPAVVTMVPTFLILRFFPLVGGNDLTGQGGIGFINSYAAVLIPFAAGPFALFFMRQFFLTLPDELGEAARIDGASEARIFWQIYLPLALPGAAVLGVLTFQAGWNSFLWPLIVLNDPQMMTVQVGLASFINEYETAYGPLMAGTVMATLPVLLIFVYAQRHIIQGFATSGVK